MGTIFRPAILPILPLLALLGGCSGDEGKISTSPTLPPATPTQADGTPTATMLPEATPTTEAPTPTPEPPTPTATDELYDLTILFTDFGRYTQKELSLRVLDRDNDKIIAQDGVQITTPQFSLAVTEILERGGAYSVEIWVDWNGNGVYEPPSNSPQDAQTSDHAWRVDAINIQGDKQVSLSSASTQTDIDW